jgi:hypothetical protein
VYKSWVLKKLIAYDAGMAVEARMQGCKVALTLPGEWKRNDCDGCGLYRGACSGLVFDKLVWIWLYRDGVFENPVRMVNMVKCVQMWGVVWIQV